MPIFTMRIFCCGRLLSLLQLFCRGCVAGPDSSRTFSSPSALRQFSLEEIPKARLYKIEVTSLSAAGLPSSVEVVVALSDCSSPTSFVHAFLDYPNQFIHSVSKPQLALDASSSHIKGSEKCDGCVFLWESCLFDVSSRRCESFSLPSTFYEALLTSGAKLHLPLPASVSGQTYRFIVTVSKAGAISSKAWTDVTFQGVAHNQPSTPVTVQAEDQATSEAPEPELQPRLNDEEVNLDVAIASASVEPFAVALPVHDSGLDEMNRYFNNEVTTIRRAHRKVTADVNCSAAIDASIKGAPFTKQSVYEDLILDGSSSTTTDGELTFSWTVCHLQTAGCTTNDFPPFGNLNTTNVVTIPLAGMGIVCPNNTAAVVDHSECFDTTALIGETYQFSMMAKSTSGCTQTASIDVLFDINGTVVVSSSSSSEASSSSEGGSQSVVCTIQAVLAGAPQLTFPSTGALVIDGSNSHATDVGGCSDCEFAWKVCRNDPSDGSECNVVDIPSWLMQTNSKNESIVRITREPCGTSIPADVLCAPNQAAFENLAGLTYFFVLSVDQNLCVSTAVVAVQFPVPTPTPTPIPPPTVSPTPVYGPCSINIMLEGSTIRTQSVGEDLVIDVSGSYDSAYGSIHICPGCTYQWSVCSQRPFASCPTSATPAPAWIADAIGLSSGTVLTISHTPCGASTAAKICPSTLDDLAALSGTTLYFTANVMHGEACQNELTVAVSFEGTPNSGSSEGPSCSLVPVLQGSPYMQHLPMGELILDATRSYDAADPAGKCTKCIFSWEACLQIGSNCSTSELPAPFKSIPTSTSSEIIVSLTSVNSSTCVGSDCPTSFDPASLLGETFLFTVTVSNDQCIQTDSVYVHFVDVITTQTPEPVPPSCPLVVDLIDAPETQMRPEGFLLLDAHGSYDSRSGTAHECANCVFSWKVCHQLVSECIPADLPLPFQMIPSSTDPVVNVSLAPINDTACLGLSTCPSFDPESLNDETYVFTVTVTNPDCQESRSLTVNFRDILIPTITPGSVVCALHAEIDGLAFQNHPITSEDLILNATQSHPEGLNWCPSCNFLWEVCRVDGDQCIADFPQLWLKKVDEITSPILTISKDPCTAGSSSGSSSASSNTNGDETSICAGSLSEISDLIGEVFQFSVHVQYGDCVSHATVTIGFSSVANFTCDRCLLFERTDVQEQLVCTYIADRPLYTDENNITEMGVTVNPADGLVLDRSQYDNKMMWEGVLVLNNSGNGNVKLNLPTGGFSPVTFYGTTPVPKCNQPPLSNVVCNMPIICDPDVHVYNNETNLCECAGETSVCESNGLCHIYVSGKKCEETVEIIADADINCDVAHLTFAGGIRYDVAMTCQTGDCLITVDGVAAHPRTQSVFFEGDGHTNNTIAMQTSVDNQNLTFTKVQHFTDNGNTLSLFSLHGPSSDAIFTTSSLSDGDYTMGTITFSDVSFVGGESYATADKVIFTGATSVDAQALAYTDSPLAEVVGTLRGGGGIYSYNYLRSYNADNRTLEATLGAMEGGSVDVCGSGPTKVDIKTGGSLKLRLLCGEGGGPVTMLSDESELIVPSGGKIEIDTPDLMKMTFQSETPQITRCTFEDDTIITVSAPVTVRKPMLYPILICYNAYDEDVPTPVVEGCDGCSVVWEDASLWLRYIPVPLPEPVGLPQGNWSCSSCVLFDWANGKNDKMYCSYTFDQDVFTETVQASGQMYPADSLELVSSDWVDAQRFDFLFEETKVIDGGVWSTISDLQRSPIIPYDVITPPKCNSPPSTSVVCGVPHVCSIYHTYNNKTNLCECTKPPYGVDPVCDEATGECIQVVETEEDCKKPMMQTGALKMNCPSLSVSFGRARNYQVPMKCKGLGCLMKLIRRQESPFGTSRKMHAQTAAALTDSPSKSIDLTGEAGKSNEIELSDTVKDYTYNLISDITVFTLNGASLTTSSVLAKNTYTKVVVTQSTLAGSKIVSNTLTATSPTITSTTPSSFIAKTVSIDGATIASDSILQINATATNITGVINGGGAIGCVGTVRSYNTKSQTRAYKLMGLSPGASPARQKTHKMVTLQAAPSTPTTFEVCGTGPNEIDVPTSGTLIVPLVCQYGGGPMQTNKVTFESGSILSLTEVGAQTPAMAVPQVGECVWGTGVKLTIDIVPTAFTVIRGLQCIKSTGTPPTPQGCSSICPCTTAVSATGLLTVTSTCTVPSSPAPVEASPSPEAAADTTTRAAPVASSSTDGGLIGGLVGGIVGGVLFLIIVGALVYIFVLRSKEDDGGKTVDDLRVEIEEEEEEEPQPTTRTAAAPLRPLPGPSPFGVAPTAYYLPAGATAAASPMLFSPAPTPSNYYFAPYPPAPYQFYQMPSPAPTPSAGIAPPVQFLPQPPSTPVMMMPSGGAASPPTPYQFYQMPPPTPAIPQVSARAVLPIQSLPQQAPPQMPNPVIVANASAPSGAASPPPTPVYYSSLQQPAVVPPTHSMTAYPSATPVTTPVGIQPPSTYRRV